MDKEQLAALDRAATQGELIDLATLPDQIQSLRNHADERRGKGWLKSAANLEASAYLIETLAAEVAKYRTGKLVLIDDGAVERVAQAIDHQLVWEIEADVLASSLTCEEQIKVARAALSALRVK